MRRPGNLQTFFSGLTARQRYSLFVSVAYIAIGLIIAVRSLLATVVPLAVLGIVFIALGAVRIRDFLRWRRSSGVG